MSQKRKERAGSVVMRINTGSDGAVCIYVGDVPKSDSSLNISLFFPVNVCSGISLFFLVCVCVFFVSLFFLVTFVSRMKCVRSRWREFAFVKVISFSLGSFRKKDPKGTGDSRRVM